MRDLDQWHAGDEMARRLVEDFGDGTYSISEAAEVLGEHAAQVVLRIDRGELMVLDNTADNVRLPKVQFQEDGTLLPGTAQVCSALAGTPLHMRIPVFLKAARLLREGRVQEAVTLAEQEARDT